MIDDKPPSPAIFFSCLFRYDDITSEEFYPKDVLEAKKWGVAIAAFPTHNGKLLVPFWLLTMTLIFVRIANRWMVPGRQVLLEYYKPGQEVPSDVV